MGGSYGLVIPHLDDVRGAAARIRGRVLRTPVRRSEWLSGLTGGDVYLKLEAIQSLLSRAGTRALS